MADTSRLLLTHSNKPYQKPAFLYFLHNDTWHEEWDDPIAGWEQGEVVYLLDEADWRAVERRAAVRIAKRESHPDRGGDAEQFRQVMRAEQLLRDAGLI